MRLIVSSKIARRPLVYILVVLVSSGVGAKRDQTIRQPYYCLKTQPFCLNGPECTTVTAPITAFLCWKLKAGGCDRSKRNWCG